MKIELWEPGRIRPYDKNPRQNDQAVEAVARSIREYGFNQPIVVDVDGVIIVGHTRWKAAQKLGLEKVPVHVATDLTPEQVKAYRIADNKTAELAEWDYELLPIELGELQGMNYDLGLLGFSAEELAKLLDPGVKEGLCDPDEVPEPPDEPITRPGACGSWASTGCSAATAASPRTSTACWPAPRSTWSTPTRCTT
ncbi:MAG: ParB N-terminal domain-containing protein [Thermoguttaceae bacterium]